MSDVDAGTVKATVRITLEDEGTQQAEERLNALKAAAGDAGGAVASAGDNFAQFGEQASTSAEGTKTFSAALGELPKITESGTSGVVAMTNAVTAQQDAFAGTAGALTDIQKPLETYNQNLQAVTETISSPHLAENMSAFQDALENPYPFQMIQSYLSDTGQSWSDFTSSIGGENAAMLSGMATSGKSAHEMLSGMSSSADEFTSQFAGVNTVITATNKSLGETSEVVANVDRSINALGGVGSNLYGPFQMAGRAAEGGGIGELFGGITGVLSDIAMPLMAIQMIGMAVGALGQSIYDSAAIAEGPAAHGYGTFTGAIDTFGATAQKSWQQFSEGFGQGLTPSLDAINNVNAQNKDDGFFGGIGHWLGTNLGALGDTLQIGAGVWEEIASFGTNKAGYNWIQAGSEGFANYWAQMTGQPEPYPGPMPPNANPMQSQINAMTALANNPEYLAAQAYYQSAAAKAQKEQAYFDVSHYGTGSPLDYLISDDVNHPGQHIPMQDIIRQEVARASGDYGMDAAYTDPLSPNCFPAGTPVLLADGTEKPIEALQVGEQVLAHDGVKQLITPILALIPPHVKPVYELVFADGNTLTLTDAHPVATNAGWKSLNPEATSQENPNLEVSTLQIGDTVITVQGTCELVTISPLQGLRQVYNISVDEPHTFYAGGVLVHNKRSSLLGQQIADQVQNIQLPSLDFSGIGSQISSALSGIGNIGSGFHIDLSGLTGIGSQISTALTGLGSISLPSIPDLSGQISGMLSGAFSSISLPSLPNIAGALSSQLSSVFAGISLPSVPDLGAMLSGAMSGIFGNIGIPKPPDVGAMITGAISGIFGNISLPPVPNIGGAISGALSAMLGSAGTAIPGFAGGVEGFLPPGGGSSGIALVGESGPELISLPAGASVYPMSAGNVGGSASPISLGGGGSAPQSINLVVQLDSQSIISAIGLPLSQSIRVASGLRGY